MHDIYLYKCIYIITHIDVHTIIHCTNTHTLAQWLEVYVGR